MMDLFTILTQKQNSSIYVNGTIYKIDGMGICRDVAEADAKKMLSARAWTKWDGKDPRERLETIKKEKLEKYKANHQAAIDANLEKRIEEKVMKKLLGAGWTPPAKFSSANKAKSEQKMFKDKPVEDKPVEDKPVEDKPVEDVSDQLLSESPDSLPPPIPKEEEIKIQEPSIPEGDEEWPDPDPRYSREWLEACADAYEVKYRKNIGNEKLVEKIKDSMYEKE